MLTTESYQMAWGVYLAAALGLLWLVRQWLRPRSGAALQVTLLLMLAALVLTPSLADPELEHYGPAVVVAVFDLLTHGPESIMRSVEPLLLMQLLAVALGLLFLILTRWVLKPKTSL
ncbi:MAG: hypothetical protein O7F73_08655 [Gammaproteobacteria bacterium]|nr:hypothetical protein [Gammaproteobacteria bacterium]